MRRLYKIKDLHARTEQLMGIDKVDKYQERPALMTLTTLPVALKPAVEKAAVALSLADTSDGPLPDGTAFNEYYRSMARAAILAFLNAAIKAGEAREGRGWDHSGSGYWAATTSGASMLPNDFIALILRMGDTP
jgi:hypothetical protein